MTTWIWVLLGWLTLAILGHYLLERTFMMALGALMVATTYASLRSHAWLEAFRLGRRVERAKRRPAAPPPQMDTDTVDLTRYRQERDRSRGEVS